MEYAVIIDDVVLMCATYDEALEVAAIHGGEIC